MSKKIKEIVLANPRGFCAGVDRAIDIDEKSLEKYNEPVYVRHQVVHNKRVVEGLEKKGVKFVKEVSSKKRTQNKMTEFQDIEKVALSNKKITFATSSSFRRSLFELVVYS